MTRVLFLQDSGLNESLALTSAAALLEQHGHWVSLLLGDEERFLQRSVIRRDPQLVVIPCPVGGQDRALLDAQRVKTWVPQAVVILGGTSATFAPELARLTSVDFVLVGEAEHSLVEAADRLADGLSLQSVPNLVFEREGELVENPLRPLVQDLDTLPLPQRGLYYRYNFAGALSWKKFSTGRGCLHSCSYCWNTALREKYEGLGSFIRRKSPARVVSEINAVRMRWPLHNVHFSDDLFTVHPAWLEDFAPRYRAEVGLPFTCNTSAQLATERAVAALRQAGCRGIALGVESGDEDLRKSLLGKALSDVVIRTAASRIKSAGIELFTFNMVGIPGERPEDVLKTIALNRSIGVDAVRVNMAVPLKHTNFRETAFTLGLLDGDRGIGDNLARGRLNLANDDAKVLEALYALFIPAVHSKLPLEMILKLARRRPRLLQAALRTTVLFEERRITRLGWLEGARLFRHVGNPKRRTANYVSLI